MVNLQNIKVKADSSFQTVCPFPVGFVYSSMNSTSPASIFGGSWTEIKGRFPYFNAGTGTGGANSNTLTISQMPPHSHKMPFTSCGSPYGLASNTGLYVSQVPVAYGPSTYETLDNGSGSSVNNMPAYQTLYAWYRTL